jgi:NADPH2:quinone reductase
MKAGVSSEDGLRVRDVLQPRPKPNEVLVKVKVASLNRADLGAARGQHGHGALGCPIGLEWAGEVVEAGADVQGFQPGDRVMCTGTGGYAE